MKEDEEDKAHYYGGNGLNPINVTPLKLLAIILKSVLKDRITNEEIELICSTYYKTIEDWWG